MTDRIKEIEERYLGEKTVVQERYRVSPETKQDIMYLAIEVEHLSAELTKAREENAELRRERDEWKREYSLINAGQLMAEEQVKKVEAELAKKSAEKEVVEERLRKVLLRLDSEEEE